MVHGYEGTAHRVSAKMSHSGCLWNHREKAPLSLEQGISGTMCSRDAIRVQAEFAELRGEFFGTGAGRSGADGLGGGAGGLG